MKKRLFSILTALCLCLSMLPTTAFAEGSTEETLVCTCETACTAESMNTDCPVCGAEGASAEDCAKYVKPADDAPAQPEGEPVALNNEIETLAAATDVSTEKELTDALADSSCKAVRLTEDITLSTGLTVSRSVTLDLNDHVLTITGENQFITVSGKDTTMTLTDSAATKTERRFSIDKDGAWVLDENDDETVTGGVITGGKTGADLYGTPAVNSGVCIKNHGTLNVTNGTVSAPIRNIRGTIAGSGTFNGTVINEDKLTGGTFNGPVANYIGQEKSDTTISGGIFYGTVANGYNYYTANGEEGLDGRNGGLISGGTFYGKVTNAFSSKIAGGSFYGEVDNRDRSDFRPYYRGVLAGGTFYAGHPGTVADGCCTVTYEYPFEETYAIQIVQKGEKAIRPTDYGRNDFTLGEWYDFPYPDGPTQDPYDFDTLVEEDTILFGIWTNTFYGIHITDKNGDVYNITDKNADDVLGDGTVVYTPGYWNETEIPDEYWADDDHTILTDKAQKKLLAGEGIPGLRFPRLTLNGAELQQIKADRIWVSKEMQVLCAMLQLELVGDNTITCNGDNVDAIYAIGLMITGTGSLNATATGQNAAAIAVESEGGSYFQYGGDVTLYGTYSGIHCSEAYFEFAAGKLTASSSKYALYCESDDNHFKITSDTTTFYYGSSEKAKFEIKAPFTRKSLSDQVEAAVKEGKLQGTEYGPIILYAQLTSNHTVTFDMAGGSAVDAQNVAYGETLTPVIPTKSGYTFAGWYLDGKAYDFTAPVTENLTLTAKWTTNSYTITYDLDGGTAGENAPTTHTYGTATVIPDPTRSGYTFAGWLVDGGTTAVKALTLGAADYTSDISLKAIWTRNSSGGSSGSSSSYPITVPDKAENGSVAVSPKNASKGSTVTITVTPDSGYVLETISVTDKNSNDLKLTDKGNGKYTFTMPGSKVEIKVTFMEDNSVLNFFYDVPNDAYYYEAVKWAVENGITGGVGNSLFAPNQPCTRAQIVTFLWRAAGSPVVNYLMPFMDVDESVYYAEAVRWAASTGIVTGLTETTFGADGVCTRAQAAAMIYRYAQAQGKGFTGAWMFLLPFTDVPEWAYESVAWCYMNGVTTGVSETAFAPGNDCTRAQIVTFLYRAYQDN